MCEPCRLCLDQKGETIDLFDNNYCEKTRLGTISGIEKLFCITIKPSERMKCICVKCIRLVEQFSDFFTSVITSQMYLSKYANDYKGTFKYQPPNRGHPDNFKQKISAEMIKIENLGSINQLQTLTVETIPIYSEVKEESLNQSQIKTNIVDNSQKDNIHFTVDDEHYEIKLEFSEENSDPFTDDCLDSDQLDCDQLNIKRDKKAILKKHSNNINIKRRKSNRKKKLTDRMTPISNNIVKKNRRQTGELKSSLVKSNQRTDKALELEEIRQRDPDNQEEERHLQPVKLLENGNFILKGPLLEDVVRRFYKIQCELCPNKPQFDYLNDMFNHYETEHDTKGYIICCDTRCYTREKIVHHMARHMQNDAFRCPICKKDLLHKSTLKAHLQTHLPESERPHKCDVCDRRYSYPSGLRSHKETHLPVEQRRTYKCKHCDKSFPSMSSKSHHVFSVHSGGRQCLCPECGRGFPSNSSLEAHLQSHDKVGENNVQCKQCGAILKNQRSLISHQKMHNEKRIQCTKCNFATYRIGQLNFHMRVKHSDNKPHECKFCGKRFKLKSGRDTHLAQHTGEKKYSCTYCPRTFVSSGNCYSHRKRMHSELYAKDMNMKREQQLEKVNSKEKECIETESLDKDQIDARIVQEFVQEEIKKLDSKTPFTSPRVNLETR